jgi:oligopeptidase A
MELRGVGLEGEAQEAFNAASQELAELATRFGNQVLDATNAWSLTLTSAEEVEGLPGSLLEQLAQAARQADVRSADGREASAEDGPWLLGLDMPRFGPFLQYSRRRDLRDKAYRAHVSRASGEEGGNWPLIRRILELRLEQAKRLGYGNWAEVSLASKMAGSVAEVERLLEDLRIAAYPAAERELDALRDCAARAGAAEAQDIQPWDVSFWAEARRQELFALDSEALRPWFPLP